MPRISRLFLFLSLVTLAACQQGIGIDRTKMMEEFKGPNVETVEATLLKSAEESEKAGDYTRATTFYNQLIEKYPAKSQYKVARAETLRKQGKIDEAMAAYDAVLKDEPDNLAALEGKMLCRFARGEQAETSQMIQQIMAKDPARWRTLNVAGILFANRNMVDEAMAYYERALTISRDNPSILNNVGLTLAMDRQYDKAIDAMQRASTLSANNSVVKKQLDLNLALIYGTAGNMEMAEKVASQHLSGPALYNNLGYYAKLSKNNAAAKDYFNMALTKSPSHYARAWDNLETVNDTVPSTDNKTVKVKAGTPIPQPKKGPPPVEGKMPDAPPVKAAE